MIDCRSDCCEGTTRLLLTKIPFFREVILMSFYCDHCHFKNNEIQPAGEIQEQGSKHIFKITHGDDLQRQVIKSDTAILRIEDLDVELPAGRGRLTNIEGLISNIIKDLESDQRLRKKEDPETYDKIEDIVESLIKMGLGARLPFTMTVDDPAGNSSIEPFPEDSSVKDKYIQKQYPRTPAQNAALGLGGGEEAENGASEIVPQLQQDSGEGMEDVEILEGKVYKLPVECPGCTKPAHMLLQMVNIPHFKQVVISTTKCDNCDFHTSDVKTGGEVPEKGQRIWLDVKGPEDLGRDILKSENCLLKIVEYDFSVSPGSMGGRFTTVEGLLTQVRDQLKSNVFDTDAEELPDSMPLEAKRRWSEFFKLIDSAISGELQFTILMEDPLGGCYIETFGEPGEDPNVRIEEYERTEEEEDDLGLNDMRTHLNEHGEYVKEPPGKATAVRLPTQAPPQATMAELEKGNHGSVRIASLLKPPKPSDENRCKRGRRAMTFRSLVFGAQGYKFWV